MLVPLESALNSAVSTKPISLPWLCDFELHSPVKVVSRSQYGTNMKVEDAADILYITVLANLRGKTRTPVYLTS